MFFSFDWISGLLAGVPDFLSSEWEESSVVLKTSTTGHSKYNPFWNVFFLLINLECQLHVTAKLDASCSVMQSNPRGGISVTCRQSQISKD